MKYSYMPTNEYRNKVKMESYGKYYNFMDSNETILIFRDQYRRRFIFAPVSAVCISMFTFLVLGFLIGKVL